MNLPSVAALLALTCVACGVEGANVIGLPLSGSPSHVFVMGKIFHELQGRGHTVRVRVHMSLSS